MNDKKHSTKTRKKRTVFIVVIISVLIVVVGGASVWWYYADKKAQEIAVEQREKAKESFNALNLAGDIEKGADYVSLIESNKGNIIESLSLPSILNISLASSMVNIIVFHLFF